MNSVVVHQTGITVFRVWFTVGTLVVGGGARVAVRVDSEQIFATGSGEGGLVGDELAVAAIDGPVVVAVVVDGTLSIEQQTILTRFQSQGSVRAEEELVTMIRVQVGLLAVWLGALWDGRCIAERSQSQAQDDSR